MAPMMPKLTCTPRKAAPCHSELTMAIFINKHGKPCGWLTCWGSWGGEGGRKVRSRGKGKRVGRSEATLEAGQTSD